MKIEELDKLGHAYRLKRPAPKGLGTAFDAYANFQDEAIRKLTALRNQYDYSDLEYNQINILMDGWIREFTYEVYLRWRAGEPQK